MQCPECGNKAYWQCDFTFEDYGYEGNGIISEWKCSGCPVEITITIPLEDDIMKKSLATLKMAGQMQLDMMQGFMDALAELEALQTKNAELKEFIDRERRSNESLQQREASLIKEVKKLTDEIEQLRKKVEPDLYGFKVGQMVLVRGDRAVFGIGDCKWKTGVVTTECHTNGLLAEKAGVNVKIGTSIFRVNPEALQVISL